MNGAQIWAAKLIPCGGATCDDAFEIVNMETGQHVALVDIGRYGRATWSNADALKATMEANARAAHNAQLIAKSPQLLALVKEWLHAFGSTDARSIRTRILIAEAEGKQP